MKSWVLIAVLLCTPILLFKAQDLHAQEATCAVTNDCELQGQPKGALQPSEDISPPELVRITLEPQEIDTSVKEQTITVTLVISDDQFVVWPGFMFTHEAYRSWYSIPDDQALSMKDIGRIDTAEGSIFTWQLTLPQTAAGGKWLLHRLDLQDLTNRVYYERFVPEYDWPPMLDQHFITNLSERGFPPLYKRIDASNLQVEPHQMIDSNETIVGITAHITTVQRIGPPDNETTITFTPQNAEAPKLEARFTTSSCTNGLSTPDVCGHSEWFCWGLVEGQSNDGVFRSRIRVPAAMPSGPWVIKEIIVNQRTRQRAYFSDCSNCETHPLIGTVAFEIQPAQSVFMPTIANMCQESRPNPVCLPSIVLECVN